MKKLILTIICCLCTFGASLMAQDKCDNSEKYREFKEFKMKFLAQEMELKESQQERFFELYDKMICEKKAAFSKVHQLEKKLRSGKELTNAEYEQYQTLMDEARAKDLEIDKRYNAEFLKVISSKQLYKMKQAEGKFKDKIREMCGSKKSKKKGDKKKSDKKK